MSLTNSTLQDTAIEVGKLRYDALCVFLVEISRELERQRDKDREKGRTVLANETEQLITEIIEASETAKFLFERFRNKMEHEFNVNPDLIHGEEKLETLTKD